FSGLCAVVRRDHHYEYSKSQGRQISLPNSIHSTMALEPPFSNYEHEIYAAGMLGGRKPARPLDWRELERDAYAMLSRGPRGYTQGGAGRGHTIRANREAFDEWRIVPRMLRDVS